MVKMWQAVSGSANSNDVISARKTPLAQPFSGASSFPFGGNMPDMTTGSLTVAGKLASVTQACTARTKKSPATAWGHGGARLMMHRRSTFRLRDYSAGASACHQREGCREKPDKGYLRS